MGASDSSRAPEDSKASPSTDDDKQTGTTKAAADTDSKKATKTSAKNNVGTGTTAKGNRIGASIQVLKADAAKVSKILSAVDDSSPWTEREHALQRLIEAFQDPALTSAAELVGFLDVLKGALAIQCSDRRSKIIKDLSSLFGVIATKAEALCQGKDKESAAVCRIFSFWIEALYVTLPQSIKIISESGHAAVGVLVQHLPKDTENVVLVRLLEGTKHKNDQVQTCCHENIAVLLKKQPSLKAELLAPIEKAIETGLADNSSPCRAAARSVLVAYHKLEPEKSNRIIKTLSPAVHKLFDQELARAKAASA